MEAGVAGSAGISRPWGPLALGGDIRRRRGTFLCGRGHSTSAGTGILSPGAQGVPLRSGVHPAAWNVLGRSGSVGPGGVSTVDGVVELLRRSLSVQDDAGSAAEAVLDVLDLGVCDIGEAGALGEVFADQAVGVLGRVKRWRRHSWERVVCLGLVVAGVCILMRWLVSRLRLSLRGQCGGRLILLDRGSYHLCGPPDLVESGLDPGAGVVKP